MGYGCLRAFAAGQTIFGGFRNSLASSFRNQVALLDLTRQYHSCTARFAIVLRHQLAQPLLVFAARKRRGEIFTARVALHVQPMLEPNPAPCMIGCRHEETVHLGRLRRNSIIAALTSAGRSCWVKCPQRGSI